MCAQKFFHSHLMNGRRVITNLGQMLYGLGRKTVRTFFRERKFLVD